MYGNKSVVYSIIETDLTPDTVPSVAIDKTKGEATIRANISATGEAISVRQEQPSYWLVDVMARYEITDSLSVSLNVDNLFDEIYNRSMWGYSDFGDTRSATAALRYKF